MPWGLLLGSVALGFFADAWFRAMHWLVQGYGYEITGLDVWAAYHRAVAGGSTGAQFVAKILGRELEA